MTGAQPRLAQSGAIDTACPSRVRVGAREGGLSTATDFEQ